MDGITPTDQNEIKMNRAACLMNIGAVSIALKEFGEAVRIHLVHRFRIFLSANFLVLENCCSTRFGVFHGAETKNIRH